MTSDNTEKILNEYLEIQRKRFKEYTSNYMQCGDDVSKATALSDKFGKETMKLFEEHVEKMIQPWRDEPAERVLHETIRKGWEEDLTKLEEM